MSKRRRGNGMGFHPYDVDEDDDDYVYYSGSGGGYSWEAFSEKEIAEAQPRPVASKELLNQLVGMKLDDVRTLICPTIYEIRVAWRDGSFTPMGGFRELKRTRINVYVENDLVFTAFVG